MLHRLLHRREVFSVTVRLSTQHKNSSGECPIRIIITNRGKRLVISFPKRVAEKYWNFETHQVKPTHPLAGVINAGISKQKQQIESWIISEQSQDRPVTFERIRQMLSGGGVTSIYDYTLNLIDQLTGKFSPETLANYKSEANRIEAFLPGITFDDLNHATLKRYEHHLRQTGLSENTLHKTFKILVKVFNVAIRDGITTNYPFAGYDRPKYRQTDRTFLNEQEIQKLEELLLQPIDASIEKAVNYFLLGCYSGLRVSDWQRFNASWIHGDRLTLRAKKNGELVSMKIHSRLQVAIDRCLKVGALFSEQKTNEYLKAAAKLAGIKKNLTCHVARHSFAVRCAELGISIESTAQLMGITVKTCGYYYKVTARKLDAEIEKWG